jgi:hypothetical protein
VSDERAAIRYTRRVNRTYASLALLLFTACASTPPAPPRAELVHPKLVSTDLAEVRITFSPEGDRMLWGLIGGENSPEGWQIVESERNGKTWSPPQPVTFNSPQNDFDPFFALDGSGVYFFSNRDGGIGGDDLYFVPYERETHHYGDAVNLGSGVNTPKDEWAPSVTRDGRLLFASDGHGGAGLHDLFVATKKNGAWGSPLNLVAINGPQEDFDATFLPDGSIVFTSGLFDSGVGLYLALPMIQNGFTTPAKLNDSINFPDTWTLGPSVSPSEPDVLYFTSHRAGDPAHGNIYRIRFPWSR